MTISSISSIFCYKPNVAATILVLYMKNGLVIHYPIVGKELDSRFQEIMSGSFGRYPEIGRNYIFWRNGARISFDEIQAAISSGLRSGKTNNVKKARVLSSEISLELENGIVISMPERPKKDDPLLAEIAELSGLIANGERFGWLDEESPAAGDAYKPALEY